MALIHINIIGNGEIAFIRRIVIFKGAQTSSINAQRNVAALNAKFKLLLKVAHRHLGTRRNHFLLIARREASA